MSHATAMQAMHAEELEAERRAVQAVQELMLAVAIAAGPVWHWGDGYGGEVRRMMEQAFADVGLPTRPPPVPKAKGKEPIPPALRLAVFERDAYRCQGCGTHLDLTVDHIVPESKGGLLILSNLQTLCRSCNSRKGTA